MLTQHRRENQEPAPDERVLALLDAAAAPDEPGPVPGEVAALAAFRAAHPARPVRRTAARPPRTAARTLAAAVVGAGVLLTGGMAAAATGSLPAPAQQKAHTILAKVGVTVPSGHAPAQHPRQHGPAKLHEGSTTPSSSPTTRNQPGSAGSHGAAVATDASKGHSHAGEHGQHGDGWAKHNDEHPGRHLVEGQHQDAEPSGHGGTLDHRDRHDRTPPPGADDPTPGDTPPVAVDSPNELSSAGPSDQ